MSNDLLLEGFFNNPNIPDCEKLGLIALLGCGSFGQESDSIGKETSFVSMCPKTGGGTQFIAFTYGRPESLNKMSVKTILHSIGFNGTFIDEMFTSMGDKEVIEEVVKFFRVARNTDKTKQPDTYAKLVEPKLTRYLEKLRVTDSYLTNNPKILDSVKSLCQSAYGASNDMTNEVETSGVSGDISDDGKKKQ